MLGGASGAKFVINFSVEGSGERDLQRIAQIFKGLNKSISGSESGGPVEGKGIMATLDGGLEAMEKMGEAGAGLIEIGVGILESWGGAFETLLHKAGELETMWLRLQTASHKTGEEAFKTMSEAVHLAQKLPFTESELVRLLDAGAIAHLDIMKEVGDTYENIAKKQGVIADLPKVMGDKMKTSKATVASMFADVFAKAGVEAGYRQQAMHEMSVWMETGKMGASQLKRILGHDWKEVEAKSKGGHGNVEALQEWLIKHHALGASEVQMDTYNAALQKFKGIIDLVTNSIFQPGKADGLLKMITHSLLDLYKTITEFFDESTEKGQKFLGTLRDVFSQVAGWMSAAAVQLGKAIKFTFEFIGDHPLLMKFAAAMTFVGAAVAIATGIFLTASAVIGGLILTLLIMPEVLAAPLAVLGLFPPLLVVLAGAVAMGAAAWQAWEKDFGGIKTMFLDVKLVIEALLETFNDWNEGMTSISEDTAQELEKRGLMGVFLKIGNVIRQVQLFYEGFMDGFSRRWEEVAPKFQKAWGALSSAVTNIMEAVKGVLAAFGLMVGTGKDAMMNAATSGEEWGDMLGRVAGVIGDFAERASVTIARLVGDAPQLINTFAGFYENLLVIKSVLAFIWDTGALAFHLMAAAAATAMSHIAPLADVIAGIVRSISLVRKGEFHEAFGAIQGSINTAAADAFKYDTKASEQMKAAMASLQGAGNASNEIMNDDAKKKADALRDSANNYLTGKNSAGPKEERGDLPFMSRGGVGKVDWAEGQKEDPKNIEANHAALIAGARQNAKIPPITIVAQIDKDTLFKHTVQAQQDAHEQSGGHTTHP